ncbi:hypothetical protein FNV43_RR04306 [Rhamnella rubrinervis]|uniref:Uncharacterized protein n=1 Tax=Rhamnella rubrinervis TaxID=2594499 RepID=A0A8K0HK26_9ROSA|nr:hypothetical protein FNV43_RR04306 [Rhamnella rubrinervis]
MSGTCLCPRGFRNGGHLNGILCFRGNRLFKAADRKLDHCESTSSAGLEVLSIAGLPVRFDFEELGVATENLKSQIGRVLDLLFREGSHIALVAKPKDMSDKNWDYINRQACGTIQLCLAKDQKYFVMNEIIASSLWKQLENNYEHLTTTLLYGKYEVKLVDVSNALMNNEYRKKVQIDHRESTPEALTIARGRTSNRKFEGFGGPNRSYLKSKGVSSGRNLIKDECVYCH